MGAYAIYSGSALGLAWWKRLQDEGHEVLVYIEEKHCRRVGEGIVPKTQNYYEWTAWGRQKNAVFFFDISGAGEKADALRRGGQLVVGGCNFFDRLEKERDWSESLHTSLGIKAPESKSFSSISAAKEFAASKGDKAYVFKSNKYLDASATYMARDAEDMVRYLDYIGHRYGDNISNLMQEKMDGFAFSTARWWNGSGFVGPYEATVEHKKFLNDDKGSATGCSFNLIWFYQDEYPKIARSLHWDKLGDVFRKYDAAPGLYDINALLNEDDGEPYFLESTPRLGYDSETTSQKGIADLGKFLYNLATGQPVDDLFDRKNYFASVKLSIAPYPYEAHLKDLPVEKTCVDTPVWGIDGLWSKHFIGYGLRLDPKLGLVSADPTGWIGLSSAVGPKPLPPFSDAYKFIEDHLRIPNLQYRTDAKERVEEDLDTIKALGYTTR